MSNLTVLQSRVAELAVRMVEAMGGGFKDDAAQAASIKQ